MALQRKRNRIAAALLLIAASTATSLAADPLDFLLAWGSFGSGAGQFQFPHCIAVSPDGSVYVSDTFNDRVQRFHANGGYLGQWGSHGTGNGQFDGPAGIAMDASGN